MLFYRLNLYLDVIMNNGQVYSIEDLITESTFSFQAKAVKVLVTLENLQLDIQMAEAYLLHHHY